ncbi:MAG: hypothetical protein R6X33_10125 [Candidatus Brocadiia bacterium]
MFKEKTFCAYPTKSYITNIGLDNSGTHSGYTNKYFHDQLNTKEEINYPPNVELDKQIMREFRDVYRQNKIKQVIKKFLKEFL